MIDKEHVRRIAQTGTKVDTKAITGRYGISYHDSSNYTPQPCISC